jgi:hypothetical protein
LFVIGGRRKGVGAFKYFSAAGSAIGRAASVGHERFWVFVRQIDDGIAGFCRAFNSGGFKVYAGQSKEFLA